jgi:hypothetical protein
MVLKGLMWNSSIDLKSVYSSRKAGETAGAIEVRDQSMTSPGMTAVSERSSISRNTNSAVEGNLSSREYSILNSKVAASEHLETQYENSQMLVKVLSDEIEVLRTSMANFTDNSPRSSHIDELRKVWSHEIQANSILRVLIMKNQRDSVEYSKMQSIKEVDLKEEIREISAKLDVAVKDVRRYKQKSYEREKELGVVSRRSGASFMSQQEDAAVIEEVHGKEIEALNGLVKSLEGERDRLNVEIGKMEEYEEMMREYEGEIVLLRDGAEVHGSEVEALNVLVRSLEVERDLHVENMKECEIKTRANVEAYEQEIDALKNCNKSDQLRLVELQDALDEKVDDWSSEREYLEQEIVDRDLMIQNLEGLLYETDSQGQVTQLQEALVVCENNLQNERERVRRYVEQMENLKINQEDASELVRYRQSYDNVNFVMRKCIAGVLGEEVDCDNIGRYGLNSYAVGYKNSVK